MSELFEEAMVLMTAGMGTVFFFLTVLVLTMYLTAFLLKGTAVQSDVSAKSGSNQNQLAEIAVAIAAVKHRNS